MKLWRKESPHKKVIASKKVLRHAEMVGGFMKLLNSMINKLFRAVQVLFAGFLIFGSTQAFAAIEVKAITPAETQDQRISYFFGNVSLNFPSYRSWVISNTGTEDITRTDFVISGIMYSASTNCPKVMPPQTKCQLDVRFSPFSEGYHSAALDMVFDKGGNLYFDFWGYGVR